MTNIDPNILNIDDDFLRFENIEKIRNKIKELLKEDNQQNVKLKDYIDFNEIFKDVEKKDDKHVLPNFLNYDIVRKVNEILERPYSTVIYADHEKKATLAHIGTLMSFFLYYSALLRYLYKIVDNEYLKELIKRVLAKNDGYLNMALTLYRIETSIYVIKDDQIIGSHPFIQNQNYGNQYQNK